MRKWEREISKIYRGKKIDKENIFFGIEKEQQDEDKQERRQRLGTKKNKEVWLRWDNEKAYRRRKERFSLITFYSHKLSEKS